MSQIERAVMRLNKILPEMIREVTPEQMLKALDHAYKQRASGCVVDDQSMFRLMLTCFGVMRQLAQQSLTLAELDERIRKYLNEVSVLEDGLFLHHLISIVNTHLVLNGPNYYIQKDFFDDFRRVSLEKLQFRHLPKENIGFVQLPYAVTDSEGIKFDHFWFYCGPTKPGVEQPIDRSVLCLGGINLDGVPFSCVLTWPPDDNTEVLPWFASAPSTYQAQEGFRLFINLLAYLNSGQPDLRQFRNDIRYRSPNSTKPIRADSELSRSDIILIGFNYLKEKVLREGTWQSRAHLGWRWCGPGRKDLRLSMISSSTKRWHSLDNTSQEDGEEEEP
jgi:hypothetical protein